jgi:hypothetical protein
MATTPPMTIAGSTHRGRAVPRRRDGRNRVTGQCHIATMIGGDHAGQCGVPPHVAPPWCRLSAGVAGSVVDGLDAQRLAAVGHLERLRTQTQAIHLHAEPGALPDGDDPVRRRGVVAATTLPDPDRVTCMQSPTAGCWLLLARNAITAMAPRIAVATSAVRGSGPPARPGGWGVHRARRVRHRVPVRVEQGAGADGLGHGVPRPPPSVGSAAPRGDGISGATSSVTCRSTAITAASPVSSVDHPHSHCAAPTRSNRTTWALTATRSVVRLRCNEMGAVTELLVRPGL